MSQMKTVVVAMLLGQLGLLSVVHAQTNPVLGVLQADKPKVLWQAKSITRADVSCDGQPDILVLGREKGAGSDKGKVWLGVVEGRAGNQFGPISSFEFAVKPDAQDAFCQLPVRIEVVPLICDNEDGALPGCKPSKTCKSFALLDDACDSFNFYWDSEQKKLVYWRR